MNGDTTQKIKAIIQEMYDSFVRKYIHHVFLCKSCSRCFAAKNLLRVVRDDVESRVCPVCKKNVEDITFSPLGQSWRALVRPDLEISKSDIV